MQGLKNVIVIAATNRPDMLDPALIRPGRIDRKVSRYASLYRNMTHLHLFDRPILREQIYVPPPDDQSREQILQLELGRMLAGEISCPFMDLGQLVRLTEGFSGAEIVAACSEAAMLAIEEGRHALSYQHLVDAIRAVQPQITAEMLHFYRNIAESL